MGPFLKSIIKGAAAGSCAVALLGAAACQKDPAEGARLCDNLGEPTQAPKVAPSRFVVQTEWDFARGHPPSNLPSRRGPRLRYRLGMNLPICLPQQPAMTSQIRRFRPLWGDFADPPAPS